MKTGITCFLFFCLLSLVAGETILPFRGIGHYDDGTADTTKGVSLLANAFSPTWSVLNTGGAPNWVTISGCGFRTYAEAVCVWDFQVTSPVSYITSDNEIVCQIPTRELSEFQSLPATSRLDVVFDGNSGDDENILYVGPFQWGPNIDCETPISPTRGHTTGGSIQISGRGFNDAALGELNVWFDDVAASGCSASSDGSSISCSNIPSVDEIHRYALVSVTFGATDFYNRGDVEVYLHSTEFYRYGPIIDSISGCTSAFGGDPITIHGVGFQDSILGTQPLSPDASSPDDNVDDPAGTNGTLRGTVLRSGVALIRVTPAASFTDKETGATIGFVEVFSDSINSDTEIVFDAPNFYDHTDFDDSDPTDQNDFFDTMLGAPTATVEVFYRQTRRLTPFNHGASLEFTYGPWVDSLNDNRWHAGGGENICVTGCFADYISGDAQFDLGTTTDICSSAATVNVNSICCTIDINECGSGADDEDQTQSFDLELTATQYNDRGSDFNAIDQVIRGPIVEEVDDNADYFGRTYSTNGRFDFSGENLRYTANTAFSSVDLTQSDSLTHGAVGSGTATISTDTTGSVSWTAHAQLGVAARTFNIEFAHNDGAAISCNRQFTADFGPTCSSISPWNGRIDGGDTVTVHGEFGSSSNTNYNAQVRLQDSLRGDCTWNANTNSNSCGVDTDNDDDNDGTDLDDSPFQPVANTISLGADSGTFTTPDFATEWDLGRGRRWWGQEFNVILMLDSGADDAFSGTALHEWPSTLKNCDTCDTSSRAFLDCGAYRFGPVTETLEPCKGPINGGTSVTVGGSAFDDGWYDKDGSHSRADSPHVMTFGSVLGDWSTSSLSNSALTQTQKWGAQARMDDRDASVTVIFDACNMTAPIKDNSDNLLTIYWGPRFYTVNDATPHFGIEDGANVDQDASGAIWGAFPLNNGAGVGTDDVAQSILAYVQGLHEFCPLSSSDCEEIRVLVDGLQANFETTATQDEITIYLPGRPFGTVASVCIEFGSVACNEHESPFRFDDSGKERTNWNNVICADQKVNYMPTIVSRSSNADITSGGGANELTLLGFVGNWVGASVTTKVYVGDYPATGVTAAANDIDYTNPVDVFEFNTDVSVRVSFELATTGGEDETWMAGDSIERFQGFLRPCELAGVNNKTMHWTIWGDDYHFGPSCGDLTYAAAAGSIQQPIRDAETQTFSASLGGEFLQDCAFTLCALGVNDTEPHLPCEVPQFSNRVQAPFSLDNEGAGVFSCVHRQIYVLHEFDSDSVSTSVPHTRDDALNKDTDSVAGADIGASSVGGIRVPPHPNNCGWVNFALYFPDALVSEESQRYVQCGDDNDYVYGPTVASVAGIWSNDDGDTIYGFGYNDADCVVGNAGTTTVPANCPAEHLDYRLTVTGVGWDDEFFTTEADDTARPAADVYRPVVLYDSAFNSGDYQDTHFFDDDDTVISFVPVESFGTEADISVGWFRGGLSSSPTGELQACRVSTGVTFHWGPVLISGSRDGCLASSFDPVDLEDADSGVTETVTITGRAFECCGFQELDDVPDEVNKGQGFTYCDFGGVTTQNLAEYGTNTAGTGTDTSSITCNIPANDDPSQRMYAFGVAFGSNQCTTTSSPCGSFSADYALNELGETRAEQAANNYMDICYGPKWTGGVTERNWSGQDGTGCIADPEDDDEERVTISGVGFSADVNFANISNVNCIYNDGYTTVGEIFSDAEIRCPIDLFTKQCGDDNSAIRIEFVDVPGASGNTYIQSAFVPTGSANPGFASENGADEEETVVYGPKYVFSTIANTNTGSGDNIYMPNATVGAREVRVFTDPHAQGAADTATLTFTDSLTEDWTCVSGDDKYAQTNAANIMCLFENTRSLAGAGESDDEFTIDFRSTLSSTECYVPRGHFGEWSNVRIIVDPHYDEYTNFALQDDVDRDDVDFVNPFWHWVPYTTSVSKTWSQANGLEPVTVYGAGFCFYDSVVCRFSGVDAVQGDIIADHMVVCQTPPNQGPAATQLELTFCDSEDDCECAFGCTADADVAFPTLDFNFTGVTDVWPVSGPIQGNTVVSFAGIGLESYNRIECVWHLAEGEYREDMVMYQCVSPASSQGLVHVEIVGYWYHWNSTESSFLGGMVHDFYFDFGEPNVDSVSPLSTEPGFLGNDTLITVTGSYFNGGLPDPTVNGTGVYECRWAIGANTFTDDPRELGASANFGSALTTIGVRVDWVDTRFGRPVDSYQIVCPAPTSGFDRIGAYPFSVTFSEGFEMKAEFNFDVVVSSLLSISGWESDPSYRSSDDEDDFFYYIPNVPFDIDLTIFGSGLFGGRQENNDRSSGYLVRFRESTANPDVTAYSVGNLLPTEDGLMTIPVPRDIWRNSTGEANGYVDIPVSVSVDGGYTWSDEIDVTYRRDGDLLDCIESGSAGTLTISIALIASAVLAIIF